MRKIEAKIRIPREDKVLHGRSRIRALMKRAQVYGWKCWYCGIKLNIETASIDHIEARGNGGSHDLSNLALSCMFCNRAKFDRSLTEFMEWLEWVRSPQSETFIEPIVGGAVNNLNQRTLVCAYCGSIFERTRAWQTYCDGSCRQLSYRARKRSITELMTD